MEYSTGHMQVYQAGECLNEAMITSILIPMRPVTGDLAVKADLSTVGEVLGLSPMHRYLMTQLIT